MVKISKEKFKTYKTVFDEHTLRNLFHLSSQGYFDELESPISTGKEANIFSAKTKEKKKVAIKIYRLETCDFNRMYDYIKFDMRYLNLKKQKRRIIFSWAQREFRNLLKARQAGIRVPTPLTCKDNILVMEFIGNKEPAPKVKDLLPKNIKNFYKKIEDYMKKFQKAKLVHGDLSEFNILNWDEKPVIIDLSQCSPITSANASELLERDTRNISRFFSKLGLKIDKEKLKDKILE
jgi:RIO kinase 1